MENTMGYYDEAKDINLSLVPMEEMPKEITSLEQMESWLTSLEIDTNISAQEAIKAQLLVIRFIQSPTLIDTTLDTLILGLKKSLKKADNEDQKEKLRESFSLMIQNYVFFFDARMQYAINESKDEARQMFLQAGEMLSRSVKEVALLSVGGNSISEIATVVVHNLFDESDNTSAISLFNRIWKWWNKDKIIAEKREEFYLTIYNICKKLGKYQPLIGESMIINGMIERYTQAINNYFYEQASKKNKSDLNRHWRHLNKLDKKRQKELNRIEKKREREIDGIDEAINYYSTMGVRWEILGSIGWGALGTIVVSLFIGIIRLIVKAINKSNFGGWFAKQMYWTFGLIGAAIIIFFIVEVIHIFYCYHHAKQLKSSRDNDIANINQYYDIKSNKVTTQMDKLQRQEENQIDAVFAETQNIVAELKQIAEAYNEI